MNPPAVLVAGLQFAYPDGPAVLDGLELAVARGTRTLLVGANGAGKTTLLTLLAGRHLVPEQAVRVLGRPAFADTSLARRVSFIGGAFPFDVDVGVGQILRNQRDVDSARQDRLLHVLGVDVRWRMNRVSDGQRRRVQILLGLLHACDLLLLDEVTSDLDVIARADLLAFLAESTVREGTTILYATHILDGLERWATHLAHLRQGRIAHQGALASFTELQTPGPAPLLRLVEGWLRRG